VEVSNKTTLSPSTKKKWMKETTRKVFNEVMCT
jgi:hypothetical protein